MYEKCYINKVALPGLSTVTPGGLIEEQEEGRFENHVEVIPGKTQKTGELKSSLLLFSEECV